jgi:hypothetical protein
LKIGELLAAALPYHLPIFITFSLYLVYNQITGDKISKKPPASLTLPSSSPTERLFHQTLIKKYKAL